MNRFTSFRAATLGLALSLAPVAVAQLTDSEVIDYPGAAGTFVYGVNEHGDIAGAYYMADQKRHGFRLTRGGEFVTIDVPGARHTSAYRINARGDVAGTYTDSSGRQHAFVLRGDTIETVDFPGAGQTMAYGLNSRGDLTGMYFAPGDTSKHYGWARISGRFITIDHPSPNWMSCGAWIGDDGAVAGHLAETNGAYHGYLWQRGEFTLFEFQEGAAWTFWDGPAEVNGAGDILGTYTYAPGRQRAFLLHKGGITRFEVPGSRSTRATGMNGLGQIVGLFVDSGGVPHGFLTRLEPAWRNR